jgi:hypothetical protein
MRRALASLAVVLATLVTRAASAQPSTRDVAAEELFTEGRDLIQQGRFREACEKFDASRRLEPAVGTLLGLGHCYEAQARTASAWFAYRAAAALAAQRNDPRRTTAEERAAALEPRLSTLGVVLPAVSSQAATRVSIDGEELSPDALRAPLAIDPGPHTVEARAPGRIVWTTQIVVDRAGEKAAVQIPALAPEVDLVTEQASAARAARRTIGAVLAVGGVVAIGAGAFFGVEAISKGRDANRACPAGEPCFDPAVVHENDTARTFADASTVTIPVGAAIVAVGGALFLTSREPHALRLDVQTSANGGRLGVTWSW